MVSNKKRFLIFSFISISALGVFIFTYYDFNFLISTLNILITSVLMKFKLTMLQI